MDIFTDILSILLKIEDSFFWGCSRKAEKKVEYGVIAHPFFTDVDPTDVT